MLWGKKGAFAAEIGGLEASKALIIHSHWLYWKKTLDDGIEFCL